ncbi:hypothetical protein JOC37_002603 [Desulfohalotomaculum tongense]|nr:hypothetical protein [Desulforadius tongensis]
MIPIQLEPPSHQGDSLIQDPSPDDVEDIKKAIEFAEQQEKKRKK